MISRFQRVGGFDVRNQMDTMAAKMTGKIRNVTCVMQELGYVSVTHLPILLDTKIQKLKLFTKYITSARSHRSTLVCIVDGFCNCSVVAHMKKKTENFYCLNFITFIFFQQLNQNMEPDYENMNDRVMRLPIAEELKQDMVDGITYCKKFSVSFSWNDC